MKNRYKKSIFYIFILINALILPGCVDDWFSQTTDKEISFTASVSNQWTTGARSFVPRQEYHIKPMNQLIGKDTVYLHTQVIDEFQYDEANSSAPVSRSTMINSTEELYDNISVSAYCYMGEYDPTTHTPNYFYNERAIRNGDSYKLTKNFMWPGQGQTMRFAAYAPIDHAMVNVNEVGLDYEFDGEKRIAAVVTIPPDVTQQKDLLIATTEDISADEQQPVNLNFKHALSAVRFEVGDDMLDCRITKVTMSLVYNKGVMDLKTGNLLSPWDSKPYVQDVNITTNGDPHQDITSGSQTFLMLPQTVQQNVTVTLNVVTPKGPTVISGSIAGHKWEPGKTIVYRISYHDWWEKVDVTQNGLKLREGIFFFNTNEPETQTIDIRSFKVAQDEAGVQHEFRALPWVAEYSTDNGSSWSENPPSWLTNAPRSGPGHAYDALPYDFTAGPNTYTPIDLDAKLKSKSLGSASSRYNLASNNCDESIQNTANCYVVNGHGYFKFPCIYGNAIKDGNNNTYAYWGPTNDKTLSAFITHVGGSIGSPYIKQHATWSTWWKLDHAVLLAEDTPGLVTNVRYEPDIYNDNASAKAGGITFDVPQGSIKQGNAIIGLIDDGGRIVWSWHIWVTPLCQKEDAVPIMNHAGFVTNVSDASLGWVSRTPVKKYRSQKCLVRIKGLGRNLDPKNSTCTFTVMQVGFTDMSPGESMFYQWGRKDPFPQGGGALAAGNPNRYTMSLDWYGPSGNVLPHFADQRLNTAASSTYSAVQIQAWRVANPLIWHNMTLVDGVPRGLPDYTDKCDKLPYNLWDSQRSTPVESDANHVVNESAVHWQVTSTKSVYDPSPPGFKVAPAGTFTGLTFYGVGTDQKKLWQGVVAPSGEGFIFRSRTEIDKTIFFGHPGYRDWIQHGQIYEFSCDGYFWTSGASSDCYAIYMCCMYNRPNFAGGSSHINPTNNFVMGDGLCVRSVLDEAPIKQDNPSLAPPRPRGR